MYHPPIYFPLLRSDQSSLQTVKDDFQTLYYFFFWVFYRKARLMPIWLQFHLLEMVPGGAHRANHIINKHLRGFSNVYFWLGLWWHIVLDPSAGLCGDKCWTHCGGFWKLVGQKTDTGNGALIPYTLHFSCSYHIVSFRCRVSSFPLLSPTFWWIQSFCTRGTLFSAEEIETKYRLFGRQRRRFARAYACMQAPKLPNRFQYKPNGGAPKHIELCVCVSCIDCLDDQCNTSIFDLYPLLFGLTGCPLIEFFGEWLSMCNGER